MLETWGIIFAGITVGFGLPVIILVIRDVCRQCIYLRRKKKKEGWRKKLITKEGIDKLTEVFQRPVPGRTYTPSRGAVELAVDVGISVKEAAQAMATFGNSARQTEIAMTNLGEAVGRIDPYDGIMDSLATRMAERVDRDMMDNLGDAGRRGAAAGENLRNILAELADLRSELETVLRDRIQRADPSHDDVHTGPWPGQRIRFRGRYVDEMDETEIRDALNKLRSSSSSSPSASCVTSTPSSHWEHTSGFSSVPEMKDKIKSKAVKHVKVRQRRKIR